MCKGLHKRSKFRSSLQRLPLSIMIYVNFVSTLLLFLVIAHLITFLWSRGGKDIQTPQNYFSKRNSSLKQSLTTAFSEC